MNESDETDRNLILFLLAAGLLLLIASGAFGCGSTRTAELCTTRCGLSLFGPIPPPEPETLGQPRWTCDEFDRAERVTLAAFAKSVTDTRFADACTAFRGFVVRVEPTPTWESAAHHTATNPRGVVAGLTYCDLGQVYVGNAPPLPSALAHELAHVAQRCSPADHDNWSEAGIYMAIARVDAVADADRARCFDAGAYVGPLDGGVCR